MVNIVNFHAVDTRNDDVKTRVIQGSQDTTKNNEDGYRQHMAGNHVDR